MTRIAQYLRYHRTSAKIGDIDPSYAMLRYICDRYELNEEQRYWIAWLFAMCYAGANAFYWYNEFPDYENVDVGRMTRWWYSGGRERSMCQTDRRWVRSSSMFVPAFESYRKWLGGKTQAEHFGRFMEKYSTPESRYDALYESARGLHSFGQFALFLYLEALHVVTPIDLCPTDLDLSQAWSCRYGLLYAYGLDDLIGEREQPTPLEQREIVADRWKDLRAILAQEEHPPTVWQTETLLCAFRKWNEGKRYVGFYLDRQADEIAKMQAKVPEGVFWDVLWQYRRETYERKWLAEEHGQVSKNGVHRDWKKLNEKRTIAIVEGLI